MCRSFFFYFSQQSSIQSSTADESLQCLDTKGSARQQQSTSHPTNPVMTFLPRESFHRSEQPACIQDRSAGCRQRSSARTGNNAVSSMYPINIPISRDGEEGYLSHHTSCLRPTERLLNGPPNRTVCDGF